MNTHSHAKLVGFERLLYLLLLLFAVCFVAIFLVKKLQIWQFFSYYLLVTLDVDDHSC